MKELIYHLTLPEQFMGCLKGSNLFYRILINPLVVWFEDLVLYCIYFAYETKQPADQIETNNHRYQG